MKILAIITAMLCQCVLAGTPTESLNTFRKAAKEQKFEDLWKLSAQFGGSPEDLTAYFRDKVRRSMKLAAEGWDFELIDEKIIDDCAVIIINESTKQGQKAFDIDPAYLIKQNGDWKVFPGLTNWNMAEMMSKGILPQATLLNKDQTEAYNKLQQWYEERKAVLRKEHQELLRKQPAEKR